MEVGAVVDHHELQLVAEVHLAVLRAEVALVDVEVQAGAVVAGVEVQRFEVGEADAGLDFFGVVHFFSPPSLSSEFA